MMIRSLLSYWERNIYSRNRLTYPVIRDVVKGYKLTSDGLQTTTYLNITLRRLFLIEKRHRYLENKEEDQRGTRIPTTL